jgi:hypothetical protein
MTYCLPEMRRAGATVGVIGEEYRLLWRNDRIATTRAHGRDEHKVTGFH